MSPPNATTIFILATCWLIGGISPAIAQTAAKKPNILVMMLDDMGFSDVGCYGGDVQTPNLDKIATEGVRFTEFRNCGRCCPTRGSILTGLYPHQAGIGGMEGPRKQDTKYFQYKGALHENCVTMAEVLKPQGYRTYAVGKWHVGFPENGSSPIQRGFDHWVGVYEGWSDYNAKVVEKGMLVEDDVVVKEVPAGFREGTRNLTLYYSDRAIEYATADPSKPFFIYLPHIAPHFNMGPLATTMAKYEKTFQPGWDMLRERRFQRQKGMGLFPPEMKLSDLYWMSPPFEKAEAKIASTRYMTQYAACIDEVDQGLGKIVEVLKKTGQWDNTLFIFLSDNGSPPCLGWGELSNTPFRYYKQQLFEGGVATPLVARWPGEIPPGVINKVQPGHVKDIMATVIEAAGATYPTEFKGKPIIPLEGKSLLHAMKDPNSYKDPGPMVWEHQGHRGLIAGDWKITSLYKDDSAEAVGTEKQDVGRMLGASTGDRTGKWHLFNLKQDRSETRDLAAQMPEKVAEMEKIYFEEAKRTRVMEREELNKLWHLGESKPAKKENPEYQ